MPAYKKPTKIETAMILTMMLGGTAFFWNADKILLNDKNVVPETDAQKHERFVKQNLEEQYRAQWRGWEYIQDDIAAAGKAPESRNGGIYTVTHSVSLNFAKAAKQADEDLVRAKKWEKDSPYFVKKVSHACAMGFLATTSLFIAFMWPRGRISNDPTPPSP